MSSGKSHPGKLILSDVILMMMDDMNECCRFCVGVFNPLLSISSMMVLPMSTIYAHPSDMLAVMAGEIGGPGFHCVMCINAFVILCGGVITAFVGVSGLIKRLAGDRLLPAFLRETNSRGAAYWAILCFVSLAFSLFGAIYSPGHPSAIDDFGGVYAIAFLTVLTAFGYASCPPRWPGW